MAESQKTESEKNFEIIKKVYLGINQNDPESVLKLLDPVVTRNEFEGSPDAGKFQGHAEMRAHLIAGRSTWDEGTCTPLQFFTNANKIVVLVHVKVRLKNQTQWIDAQTADGFILKNGLVTEFNSYVSQEQAFAWAGLAPNS